MTDPNYILVIEAGTGSILFSRRHCFYYHYFSTQKSTETTTKEAFA